MKGEQEGVARAPADFHCVAGGASFIPARSTQPPTRTHHALYRSQAIALYKRLSPEQVLARRTLRMSMAVAPRAYLDK